MHTSSHLRPLFAMAQVANLCKLGNLWIAANLHNPANLFLLVLVCTGNFRQQRHYLGIAHGL